MVHPIDNQYHYGTVYNLDGKIVGFNVSPDIHVSLTDDDIEKALEKYIAAGEMYTLEEETIAEILKRLQEGKE